MLPRTETILSLFPNIGGWFVFMWAIAAYGAFLFMPWITYLDIIVRLFKVDPSKGQTPRDPNALERAAPGDLIKMA